MDGLVAENKKLNLNVRDGSGAPLEPEACPGCGREYIFLVDPGLTPQWSITNTLGFPVVMTSTGPLTPGTLILRPGKTYTNPGHFTVKYREEPWIGVISVVLMKQENTRNPLAKSGWETIASVESGLHSHHDMQSCGHDGHVGFIFMSELAYAALRYSHLRR